MELTLHQALQKGAEAYRLGNVQEAAHYFTAILKANPKHPDANHNMGVLAFGVGKAQESLPFFKTALEANPSATQFWLSYIDALSKINRIAEAKSVFDEAKRKGIKGSGFDELERKFASLEPKSEIKASSIPLKEVPEEQLQSLINLYIRGQHQTTLDQAYKLLTEYPRSATLYNIIGAGNQGIGKLSEAIEAFTKALEIKPDYAKAYYNMGNALKDLGRLDEAIGAFKKALEIKPDYANAYSSMGNALKEVSKLREAIRAFKKALEIKPDHAEAYYNMGNALKDLGRLDEAIEAFTKALEIKPDHAEAFNNMGVTLRDQGRLGEAIGTFKKALEIKPDYAEVYNNIGVTFKEHGNLDEAIEAYKKALEIKPGHAKTYYNMGVTFQAQGKLGEALSTYKKALSIKPDYTEVYWNSYGTSESINEAKNWLGECLRADPKHLKAKLTLSALKFYDGYKSEFDELKNSTLKNDPYMRSFSWAFNLPKLPSLHFHRWALFDDMIALSKKDRPFYEFGVWRGEAFKHLIKTFKTGYGFDTFEGLPEDWYNEKAGTYSSEGNIPKIKGGNFIAGKFEDTLPIFFAEPRPKASIINFDADLYSSTICALNFAKPVIDQHSILIFDEFLMNENWEQDEFKALEEFCADNDYTYKVLAMSFFSKQVAVKIIGI